MPSKTSSRKKEPVVNFDPFEISPTTANLAVIMLKANEPEVLWKSLKAISEFAKQHYQNKVLLLSLGVIENLVPLIDHPHFNVRRFALLNLALMCILPEVPEKILENPETMKKLAYQLVKVEDIFTLEYTSLCVSRLTTTHDGCNQLSEANIIGTLCKRMKDCQDPDVQNNCLQTLSNMLEDPLLASEVPKNSNFNWDAILVLISSKFVSLQNAALKMVSLLVSRYDDKVLQTKFRASTGVCDLCNILERYEFRDVHEEVLKILKIYVVPGENATHLFTSGCIPRLQNYLEMALPQLKAPCLAVLTQLSFTVEGRNAIFATETDLTFCEVLLSSNQETNALAEASLGIANMCVILNSADRMSETGVAGGLCSIVVDDGLPWYDVRINTFKALNCLSVHCKPVAILVLKSETITPLRQINIDYKYNPIEGQMLAMQCYLSLLNYTDEALKVMLTETFISELLDVIGRVNIKLQLLAIKVMCILTQYELGQELFTQCVGEKVISEKLKIDHNGLRNALCQLIIDSVIFEGAELYLDLGTISFMLDNQSARYSINKWEKAIGRILEVHPSAKFGILGRLDIDNVTSDGFYVLRRLGEKFPSLDAVLDNACKTVDPIYMSIIYPKHVFRFSVDPGIRTPYTKRNLSRRFTSSRSISNRNLMSKLPDDDNLKSYLLKLRHMLGDPGRSLQFVEIFDGNYDVRERKKCSEVGSGLHWKAQILAEFVAQVMNGTDVKDFEKCVMPNVELEIAELMNQSKSNVIGIGFIRYGGMLERAILYKVLADRLGIPCAIYRKCTAIAWCAIAVPEIIEPTETEETYPAKYLRMNYVVDLSNNAKERLYQEGGYDANRITGPPIPPYVVGNRQKPVKY